MIFQYFRCFGLANLLKAYLYDSALSNSLNYHQKVYAVYSELSFPVGKLFEAKLGGRYERTEINHFTQIHTESE